MDHSDLLGPADAHADLLGPATAQFPRGGFAPEGVEAENPAEQAAGVFRTINRGIETGANRVAESGLAGPKTLMALSAAEAVGELLPKTKTDVVLTAAGFLPEAALGLTGQAAKTVAQKLAPETVDAIARAAAMKVPLTPAEILQSHALSYLEEGLARAPFASGMLETFRGLRDAAVKDARDKLVEGIGAKMGEHELGQATQEKIGGVLEKAAAKRETARAAERDALLGEAPTHYEAGRDVQRGLEAAIAPERKKAGDLYKDVAKSIPKDRNLFPLDETRNKAQEILQAKGGELSTLDAETEADVKRIADGAKSGKGQTWQKMHDLQSDYGKIAQKAARSGDGIKAGIYRDLRDATRADMEKFAKSFLSKTDQEILQARTSAAHVATDVIAGESKITGQKLTPDKIKQLKEVAVNLETHARKLESTRLPGKGDNDVFQKYNEARKNYFEFQQKFGNQTIKKLLDMSPDTLYKTVVRPDRVQMLQDLKAVVGEEGLEPLRRKFVEDLVGASDESVPKTATIMKKLADYREVLPELLDKRRLGQVQKFAARGELPAFVESAVEKRMARLLAQTPQQAVHAVMSGDPLPAEAVKNLVGKAGWEPYRRQFMERVLGESGSDMLKPDVILKKLEHFDPAYRNLFLNAEEQQEIRGIAGVQKLLGSAERLAPLPEKKSMQGGAAGAGAVALLIPSARGALLTHPVSGAATLLTPPVLAKFYLSEEGRKLLTEGLDPAVKASAKTAALVAARIAVFANNARREVGEPEQIEPETKDQTYPTRVDGAPDPATLSPAARGLLGL